MSQLFASGAELGAANSDLCWHSAATFLSRVCPAVSAHLGCRSSVALSCWGPWSPLTMAAELEASKSLSGLLSGLAQDTFYGHPGITEELLRSQLYPEVSPEEFRPFLAKMKGILKVPLLLAACAAELSLFPAALLLVPSKAERLPSSDLHSRGSLLCSIRSPELSLSPLLTFLGLQAAVLTDTHRRLGFCLQALLCGVGHDFELPLQISALHTF